MWIPQKRAGTRNTKFVFFASSGICGSIPRNARRDTIRQMRVLHLLGSMGHVDHFGASGMRNVDALFFILGWDRYRFHKKHVGIHYAELVFLHLWVM
jgi:hypothetical protein